MNLVKERLDSFLGRNAEIVLISENWKQLTLPEGKFVYTEGTSRKDEGYSLDTLETLSFGESQFMGAMVRRRKAPVLFFGYDWENQYGGVA